MSVVSLRSSRPVYVLTGVVFVGLGALPLPLVPCIAPGCEGVRGLHVFFDWSPFFGPSVSASFDAGRCAYICPHRVQLLPLTIGYLSLAETITTEQS